MERVRETFFVKELCLLWRKQNERPETIVTYQRVGPAQCTAASVMTTYHEILTSMGSGSMGSDQPLLYH